jgi:hypothetical protein
MFLAYCADVAVSPFPAVSKNAVNPDDDLRLQKIADAINTLLSPLQPQEQDRILRKITENLCHLPTPKAREVLGVIVRLFPQNESWTVDALKQRISERGIEANQKQVYNAIGYLNRKGHIRRIGYGRYVFDGIEIVTSEDLGGQPSRHEDGYRLDWTGRTNEESGS